MWGNQLEEATLHLVKGELDLKTFNNEVPTWFSSPILYYEKYKTAHIEPFHPIDMRHIKGMVFDEIRQLNFFVTSNGMIHFFFLTDKPPKNCQKIENITIEVIGPPLTLNYCEYQIQKLQIKRETTLSNPFSQKNPQDHLITESIIFYKLVKGG